MIVEPDGVHADVTDEADFVIVGTGAAGATAARVLSETGASVILLEEGPLIGARELGQGMDFAFRRLFRDGGAQVTGGPVRIPILQAACVGGSTAINSGITWRIPERAHGRWVNEFGLGTALPGAELDECFGQLERELSVKLTGEDRLGGNGRALRDGAAKLGWEGKPTHRTESGCEGSSRCLEGCRRSRRLSMNHSFLPMALRAGARLYAGCRVDRLALEPAPAPGRPVARALGSFAPSEPGGPRFAMAARARRAVLVAASAIHTPALLQRSGLGPPAQVGAHFQGHPGVAVLGVFDRPVRMWEGATQSYEVTQFRDAGLKIESLNLPPEMLAARLPGAGSRLMSRLAGLDRLALAAVPIRAGASGHVRASGGGVDIRYVPGPDDVKLALEGVRRVCEIFFASGARAVLPGVHGLPESLETPASLEVLRRVSPGPQSFSWVMTHLMGTCRMAPRASAGAVDLRGQVHGAPGVYVIDSSVFPTNLGVNPQHTIMAVAMLLTRRLAGV